MRASAGGGSRSATGSAAAGSNGSRLDTPLLPLVAPLPPDAGRKAAHLAWLAAHGFRVPAGWVVPAGAPTDGLAAALERVVEPGVAYAVRSSADVEDDAAHSFAGQFRSLLEVVGPMAIAAAVEEVRASATSPAVRSYAERVGAGTAVRMGVVVQRMVDPVVSGVAFSRNPLTGLDEVVIEAVDGRGDRLVQDGVTPDRWIHRWGDLTERPRRSGTPTEVVLEVAETTRRIAAAYGRPADVEWVWDGQHLHVVQVRPIVGVEGVAIYSRRIAKEVLPGIVPPLVWSINVPAVNRAWVDLFTEAIGPNEIDPDRLARAFAHHAYFDMGTIGDIFVLCGMPRDSLELLLGLPAGSERPRFRPTAATWRLLPRLLRLAVRLDRYDRRLGRDLPALEAELRSIAGADPAGLDDAELLARVDALLAAIRRAASLNIVTPLLMNLYGSLVRRSCDRLGLDGTRVDPALGLAGGEAYDPRHALRELAALAAALAPSTRAALEGDPTLLVRTPAAGDRSASADPALAPLRAAVERFLARFGHLAASGQDVTSPTWREQPDVVVAMLLAPQAVDAGERLGWDDLRSRVRGPRRFLLGRLFRRARTFRRLREIVSYEYSFAFGILRETLLVAGERLVARGVIPARDEIACLTLDELRDALRARGVGVGAGAGDGVPTSLADLVAERRAALSAAADLEMPEVIVGDDFVPRRRVESDAAFLRGVPTSRGSVRGRARIVASPEAWARVEPGDIVVVPHSDVAWTPVFARASGIVAASGGMLSHSSIVARELGIPCVVSVPDALALPDGALVHLDGTTGTLTIEERAASSDRSHPPAAVVAGSMAGRHPDGRTEEGAA